MEEKNHSKLIWGLVLMVVTIILCFVFVVIYFFYISPNNIPVKLGLWPYVSQKDVGKMYQDATVEIDFTTHENFDEGVQCSVVGVNVREDGYVIAPYSQFRSWDGGKITIYTNSGKVYAGALLFVEQNYNLAVFKCESSNNDKKEKISIPFVNLTSSFVLPEQTKVLAVSSPMASKDVWTGKVVSEELMSVYKQKDIESFLAVDFVIEDCQTVALEEQESPFTGGAIFNEYGSLLGFSFEETLQDEDYGKLYVVMPTKTAKYFIDDIVKSYRQEQTFTSQLVQNLVGFDYTEIDCHINTSSETEQGGRMDYFFFRGQWELYDDNIFAFHDKTFEIAGKGFYVFKEFKYGGVVIPNGSVILYVRSNSRESQVNYKLDIFDFLYKLKQGDKVELTYVSMNDLARKTVTLTV